ncbi:cytochrome P450 [Streptomyces sp. NPDC049585]|uniref:cytochrome P450 n=1 Tax=Streptomyces sp. NPDC049585 TaxID=3155154 RepID=UPI0034424926
MTATEAAGAVPAYAPRLPGGHLPWLGPVRAFGRDPVGLLSAARERVGNAFRFPLLGQEVHFACGPRAHAAFFGADETVLSAREAYRFMTPVLGQGVAYDAEPTEMEQQIGHLLPALGSRRLEAHARVMEEESEAHVARWADAGEIDLLAELNRLTVSIAARCLVGDGFHRRMGPQLATLYRDLESGIRLAGVLSPKAPLPAFRRRDRARAAIASAIAEVIAERRAAPGRATGHQDVLATLLQASDDRGKRLPDETVTGILLTMIFAGQHTSAVLATWTGLLLLRHPRHLDAVTAEQFGVLGAQGHVTPQALHRMDLLERCVREAERLHPPLTVLMRKALRDLTLDGHAVKAGSLVMVSPAVAHRMPDVFREPDRFDPSRYLPPRCEHRPPYSLIGFGGGKRRCVGLAFAYQQVKTVWSVLLRRVELTSTGGEPRPDYSTFVAAPALPRSVRYRKLPPETGNTTRDP